MNCDIICLNDGIKNSSLFMSRRRIELYIKNIMEAYERPLRILLYVRASTKKQTEKSLEIQEKECKKWAKENEFKINKIIREVGSAKNGKGQVKLIEFMDEELNVDKYRWMILCFRVDRLFRSLVFYKQFSSLMKEKKTIIFSVSEKISEMKLIKERIKEAEKEIKILSQRVKYGLENRKNNGYPLGKAPYGFKRSESNKANEIDPITYWIASTIQQMRDYEPSEKQVRVEMLQLPTMEASSNSKIWTFEEIAKVLNEANLKYKGKKWNQKRVNTVYHSFINQDIFFTNDMLPNPNNNNNNNNNNSCFSSKHE